MNESRIAVVHIADELTPRRRLAAICEISPSLGIRIDVIEASELFAQPPDIADRLAQCQAVWLFGRLSFGHQIQAVWDILQRHLSSPIPVYDTPDAIEESFNLAKSYPLVKKAGVPQAKTKFIAITPEQVNLPEAQLYRLLRKKLRWTWVLGTGIFIRTYYGTTKTNPLVNIASSRKILLDRSFNLLLQLRDQQVIGGLALRECLPIAIISDKTEFFAQEFRVFIAWGIPLLWCLDLRSADMVWQRMDEKQAREVAPSEVQLQQIYQYGTALGNFFRARFIVADFAILTDGRVVLVEINPGYCSGMPHPIGYIAVYGNILRQMVGLARITTAQIVSIAKKHSYSTVGKGSVFGFFAS